MVSTPPPAKVFQTNVSTAFGTSSSPAPPVFLPGQEAPTPPGTPQMIRPMSISTPPPGSPSMKQSPLPSPNSYPTIQKALLGGETTENTLSTEANKSSSNLPKHHPQSQFNRTGRPADSNLIKTLLANKVSRGKLHSQSSTDSSSVPQSPTLSTGGQVPQSPTPLLASDSPEQLSQQFPMSPAAQPTQQTVQMVQQQQIGVPYGDPGGTPNITQIPSNVIGLPASGYIDSVPDSNTKTKKTSKSVKRKLVTSPKTVQKKIKNSQEQLKEESVDTSNLESPVLSMDICQNVERAKTAVQAEQKAHQAYIERIPNTSSVKRDCTKEDLKTSSFAQSEISDSLSSNNSVETAAIPPENTESTYTGSIVSSSQFNGDPAICNQTCPLAQKTKAETVSLEDTVTSVLKGTDRAEKDVKQMKMAINGVVCHIGNGDYMEGLLKESTKDISTLKQNDLSKNCDVYHAKYESTFVPNGVYVPTTKCNPEPIPEKSSTRTTLMLNESQKSSVTSDKDKKSHCAGDVNCYEGEESSICSEGKQCGEDDKSSEKCSDGQHCGENNSTNYKTNSKYDGSVCIEKGPNSSTNSDICSNNVDINYSVRLNYSKNELNTKENGHNTHGECSGGILCGSDNGDPDNQKCSDGIHCGSENGDPETQKCSDGIHCGSENGDPETQKCSDEIHCGSENGDPETRKCSDGIHCGSENGDPETQKCNDGIHCGSENGDPETQKCSDGIHCGSENGDPETQKCSDGIHCGSENVDPKTQKCSDGIHCGSENGDPETPKCSDGIHCGSENGDPETKKCSDGIHCGSENGDPETQKCSDGIHCGSENGDPETQKCSDGIHCGSENGHSETRKCSDGIHCGSENGDPETQKCSDGIHCGSENGDSETRKCSDGIHCGSENGDPETQKCSDGIHCGTDESDQEENGPPYDDDQNIMQDEMPSESDLASQLLSDSMNCEDNPEGEEIIAEAVMNVDTSSQENLEENQLEESNLEESNLEGNNLEETESLFDPESLLDPSTFQPPMDEDSQPEDILAIASKEIADSFNMDDESEESILSPGISTPLDSSSIVVPNIVQNQPIAAKPMPGMTQQVIIAPAQQQVVSGGQALVAGQIVLAQNNLISQPPVALVRFVAPQQNTSVPGAIIPQQQTLVSVAGTAGNQMPVFVAASTGQPAMVSYPTTMVAVQGAQGKTVPVGNIIQNQPVMQQTIVQHNVLPQQNIVRTGTVMAATSAPIASKMPLTGKLPIPANPNQQIVYTTCNVIAPPRSAISPPPTIQVPTCPMMSGALTSPSDTASSYTPSPSSTPAPSPGLKRPSDGSKPKKKKKKKKKSKEGKISGGQSALSPMSQMYMCEWANCKQ